MEMTFTSEILELKPGEKFVISEGEMLVGAHLKPTANPAEFITVVHVLRRQLTMPAGVGAGKDTTYSQ